MSGLFTESGKGAPALVFSERILQRRIVEIAGLVRARFVDESAGEKISVASVTLQVAREVISGEEIGLRTDVAGSGSVGRTDYGRGLVVDRVAIGRAPLPIGVLVSHQWV